MKCLNCGYELKQETVCPNCGTNNQLNDETDILVRLVIDARDGDSQAANDLMAYAYPFMIKAARCYCKNDSDAQDVVQDASLKVLRSLSSLNDPKTFRSWVNSIVRNTSLDFLDRASNKHDIHFTDLENTEDGLVYDPEDERLTSRPDLQISEQARKEIITEILDSLKEEQRIIAVMYFYEGMSMKEIAQQLNIKESTVIGRISTAKKNIRSSVETIQKRDDIKLYSLSPIAWFIWLLRGWKDTSDRTCSQVLQNAALRYQPQAVHVSHAADAVSRIAPDQAARAVSDVTAAAAVAAASAGNSTPKDGGVSRITDTAKEPPVSEVSEPASSIRPSVSPAQAGRTAGLSTAAKAGITAAVAAIVGAGIFAVTRPSGTSDPKPEPVPEAETAAVQEEEPAPEVPAETPAPVYAVWAHEPDIRLDKVYELKAMETCVEFNGSKKNRVPFIYEQHGYPQSWDDTQTAYTPDSITVEQDGKFGIYDYSGNVLFDTVIPKFGTPNPRTDIFVELNDPDCPIRYYPVDDVLYYLTAPTDYSTYPIPARAFSTDFRSDYQLNWGGYSGMFFGAYTCGGRIIQLDYGGYIDYVPASPQFLMNVSDFAYIGTGEEYDHITGFSCVDENGIRYEVSGYPYNFVNGYFAMDTSLRHTNGVHVFSDQNQIMNASTGEPLNDEFYEEIKFFENGYCPVKKNGKWGFINEQGQAMTDFIWDDVSTLYEGKAYVGINGMYGVLDLVSSIQNGTLTLENVYGDTVPAAPEEPESASARIGVITIISETPINIRTGAGTSYDKVSQTSPGSAYDVYETAQAEGYTWYRISDNAWVADQDGQWVEFKPE